MFSCQLIGLLAGLILAPEASARIKTYPGPDEVVQVSLYAQSLKAKELSPHQSLSQLPHNQLLSIRADFSAVFQKESAGRLNIADLAFDAVMPDHAHGTLTTPKLKKLSDRSYLIDGVKFHMKGFWELHFSFKRDGQRHHLVVPYTIQ